MSAPIPAMLTLQEWQSLVTPLGDAKSDARISIWMRVGSRFFNRGSFRLFL